jgi:hypothetical protein
MPKKQQKMVEVKETYRLGGGWDLTDKRQGVYKVYTDGSVELTCKTCAEVYELPADNKFAGMVVENNETAKVATCTNCWRIAEEKGSKKKNKFMDKDITIRVGMVANQTAQHLARRESDGDIKDLDEAYDELFEFYWGKVVEKLEQYDG